MGNGCMTESCRSSCNNVIPKDKQDKFLLDKMYAERDGIVYKAIMALNKSL